MTRTRTLLAGLAVTAVVLACAGSADASGNFSPDGAGRIYAEDYGTLGGAYTSVYAPFGNSSSEAGLYLSVYASPTMATVYGPGAAPFTPDGNGAQVTNYAPYTVTSTYRAGCADATSCLQVTETLTAVTGDSFSVDYHVANPTDHAIAFRAINGAHLDPGSLGTDNWQEARRGLESDPNDLATPMYVGALNERLGSMFRLEEDPAHPWQRAQTRVMEGDAFQVLVASGRALTSGLSNSVDPAYRDAAVAVQWDDYHDTGLGAGLSADFRVIWDNLDYDPLALAHAPSGNYLSTGDAPGGTPVTETASAQEWDGTPTDLTPTAGSPHPLRYEISGANPQADSNGDPLVAGNGDATGVATISYSSRYLNDDAYYYYWYSSEADYVDAYVDLNDNGRRDFNEPQEQDGYNWFDRFGAWDQNCYGSGYPGATGCEHFAGELTTFQVKIFDANRSPMTDGTPAAGPAHFSYQLIGQNGTAVISDPSQLIDPSTGLATFQLTGAQPGDDEIRVTTNLDPAVDSVEGDDPGETRIIHVHWFSRLTVNTSQLYLPAGAGVTTTINASLWDTTGAPASGAQLHYAVTGTNNNTSGLTSATAMSFSCPFFPLSDYYYYYYEGSCAGPTLDGTSAGKDTVTIWYGSGSSPALTDPQQTVTVHWLGSQAGAPIQPVALTGHVVDRTVGGDPAALTAAIQDESGNPAPDSTEVAYAVYRSSADRVVHYAHPVSGVLTIPSFSDNTPGIDHVDVWLDTNSDGQIDDGEYGASDQRSITWHAPITLTVTNPAPYTGSNDEVYAYFRNAQGELIANQPYSWTIGSANPGSGNALATSYGDATITWSGLHVGLDTVTVSADVIGDSTPETASIDADWQNQLSLTPVSQTVPAGDTASVAPCVLSGSFAGARDYHYELTGDNFPQPQDGVVTDVSGYGFCDAPDISWTGTHGVDTLTVWADLNGNGTQDASDPTGVATVTWNENRVALALNNDVASVGASRTVTATLFDSNGAAVPGEVLRWTRSGANGVNALPFATLTDGSGQSSLTWTGQSPGDDYTTVYADYNHNDILDPGEPSRSITMHWYPRITVTVPNGSKIQGDTQTATVSVYDDDHQPLGGQTVNFDISGANATSGTVQTASTGAVGTASIPWTGANPGADYTRVWIESGTPNGAWDSGEYTDVVQTYWGQRLSVTSNNYYPVPGTDTATVNLHLTGFDSNPESGATLHYRITGVNPATGTKTTDGSGNATITWTSPNGGDDSVEVWVDANPADGTPDVGSDQSATIHWTNHLSLAQSTSSGYVTNTHTVTGNWSGANISNRDVYYSVIGANPKPTTADGQTDGSGNLTPISWTGGNPGLDIVVVWVDTNNDGIETGEPHTEINFDWLPVLTIQMPSGTHTAGPSATDSATITLLDPATGNPQASAPVDYQVSGVNAASGQVVTDSQGHATIPLSGVNAGTDTLQVTAHNNTAIRTTATISWATPPVTLTLTPSSDSKLIDNAESVTAHLAQASTPLTGKTINWHVSGANTVSATSGVTNGNGDLVIGWTGTAAGTDTLSATAQLGANYNPSAGATISWLPLAQLAPVDRSPTTGSTHTETITFLHPDGSPYSGVDVYYEIDGANPTPGGVPIITPRLATDASAGGLLARATDSSGSVSISWTGYNAGTDTLQVWGDTDGTPGVSGTDLYRSVPVTWGGTSVPAPTTDPTAGGVQTTTTPQATSTSTSTTSPTGSTSATVVPGSPEDIDGLPTPLPPVAGKTVNATPVSGTVRVRLPKSKKFINLLDAESLPVGTIVDVRHGRVTLTAAQNLKGGTAEADFYQGQFQILQKHAAKPITDLKITGGDFGVCGKTAKHASAAQKHKVQQLWGSGTGLFRTKGKYGTATVRGTTWLVADYCDGTLVQVTKGIISVGDLVRHKNVTVKAPNTYFVAAKK